MKDTELLSAEVLLKEMEQLKEKANAPDELDMLLDSCSVRIDTEYTEPDPLLMVDGEYNDTTPLFTRGNISMLQGKAKSRKSFLIALLVHMFFDQNPDGKVLIIDTEQALFHVHKALRRIYKMMGWSESYQDERFSIYALRELGTDSRAEAVERLIEKHNPDLVFIDGVRDLLRDFNDLTESSELIDVLMRLSSQYDCHLSCVLHENKNDTNARGHSGTELQNKAEVVMAVVKDGEVSTVKPRYCRNADFKEFSFRINDDVLPEITEAPEAVKVSKLKIFYDELLPKNVGMEYTPLIEAVAKGRDITPDGAKKSVSSATRSGYIFKYEDLYYSTENSKSILNSEDVSTQNINDDEIPF